MVHQALDLAGGGEEGGLDRLGFKHGSPAASFERPFVHGGSLTAARSRSKHAPTSTGLR